MTNQRLIFSLIIAVVIIGLSRSAIVAAPPSDEGQDYIVQADDWLSKLAEKFYGDPLAYAVIVEATNQKASQDRAYSVIDNPDLIEVGQRLFVPAANEMAAEVVQAVQPANLSPAEVATTGAGPTEEQRQLLASLNGMGAPPELFNEVWLNSEPLKLADLRGKVVIVEFWTFG